MYTETDATLNIGFQTDEELNIEFQTEDEKKALEEMELYHKTTFQTVSPTEVKLVKLLDSCKFTINKYMSSHTELVMIHSKLQFFYKKFMDLTGVNMNFIRSLIELTEKVPIDKEKMTRYVDQQKEIMEELATYKEDLSKTYGIVLSEQGLRDMKNDMKDFFIKVQDSIQTIDDFKAEANYAVVRHLPESGIVKFNGKLYDYTMKDGTMTTTQMS